MGLLEGLIDLAVRRRVVTLVLAALFCAYGTWTLARLRIEAFPDVTNVQVMVIALFPGQAAEDVEKQVTLAVERALTGLPCALQQRSVTSFGLAQVIVTFADDVDIYFARQQVAERLATLDLPPTASAELGPNDTPVGQIYQYTLESAQHTPTELRGWQEWVVARHLMRAAGVADVVSFGGMQKEYHVLADAAALRNHGMGLAELVEAVDGANAATSGGYLRQGEGEFVVRGRGYLQTPADIENTVVRAQDGTPVLIRHVAQVVEGHTPRRGAVARNAATDSVAGTVLLRRGENPRLVLAAVHAAVDEVNAHVLPAGMAIVPYYDRTQLVDTTLATVARNMVEGALLVALVIWTFLRTVRGSLAVAVTMPLALLTAFVGLSWAGVPANLLSMGAIDFGILLDGAVIMVENAFRLLHGERPSPREVPAVVARAAREMVRPTLFSMCIIVAAMLPIFTLQRVEGRIFRPVALTYAFALGGALLATLTVVPALSAVLLARGKIAHVEPAFLERLRRLYLRALRHVLARPWPARAIAAAALLAALVLLPRLGSEFLPQMNEGDVHITVTMPSTISLDEGGAVLAGMRRSLLAFPEVADVITEQGHPEDGTDDEAPNQAKTFVRLHPPGTVAGARSYAAVVDAMRAELRRRPGIDYNFSQPIKDRVEEAISGVRGQVVVKLYGDDLPALHAAIVQIRDQIAAVPGARDVEIYRAGQAQHVVADIDRDAIARLGLTVRSVEDAVEAAFGGKLATKMWQGERQVGVRVKLPSPEEGDVQRVAELSIPAGTLQVPLGTVAHVHPTRGRTQITREQMQRFLALKCNIEGRDMGSFVAEAQAAVAGHVQLPEGATVHWGGEFENQRRAMQQLAVVVPVSLLAIFVLLYATFGAALPAIVVLLGLPFAAVGGVFALWLTGTTLSVSAAVGFITLFGVATMDGVLLITYVRQARREHGADAHEAICEAVSRRLRPVLMTALLASLGLLPAALSHGIGAETQRPFAVVIIGGLLSATALTMLLLPSLYDWVETHLMWKEAH